MSHEINGKKEDPQFYVVFLKDNGLEVIKTHSFDDMEEEADKRNGFGVSGFSINFHHTYKVRDIYKPKNWDEV